MKAEIVGIIPVHLKRWVETETGEPEEHAERSAPIAAVIGAAFQTEDGKQPSSDETQRAREGKIAPAATVKLLASGVLFVIEVADGDVYFIETNELVSALGYAALEAHREKAGVEPAVKKAVDEAGDEAGDGGGKLRLV